MAGPWTLEPGKNYGGIPTWAWPRSTTVHVQVVGGGNGRVRFQAGASPDEDNDVNGETSFSRSFGGFRLNVTNIGSTTLKVWTA
ncbi:hypothetical protein DDB_G0269702 [Dictyostelium discoideum AX4]|uniref:Uncharacterized protein DDB_G0269702 n=1 Tax=Dictyostelium discoideum TaxID=44689 RepID=Y9702_DICDI|nr:hypothetical protein DDB_G0269702 [Dictyostelium discoideum AX4]Q55DC6.2 RecName: Full=Uncharacterized protein DDB_G0269702 [Dictyostelium discoideum]EAL72201.2 hypothetical protein DDB_G0269702 [Dictyostelium discoideum AX4]|eukprot:XP_646205.2 hypothetical protein DDB_G0269702 [Dictyostelium discoideum AX4]